MLIFSSNLPWMNVFRHYYSSVSIMYRIALFNDSLVTSVMLTSYSRIAVFSASAAD